MSGTTDKNWKSYIGDSPDVSGFENPPDPENYSDIMKFGNCTNVQVNSKTVAAGQENCVDAVRGGHYQWTDCTLPPGAGVSAVTLKGAIDGWGFTGCNIGHGKQTDIELGQFDNYWVPGRAPTKNGTIDNCVSNDGTAIKITCWNADKPTILNTVVKIVQIPWIVWFPYFCFRYICIHWLSLA